MKQNTRTHKSHLVERKENIQTFFPYYRENARINKVVLFMLKKKAEGLLNGIFIPDSFIAEIDSFIDRNQLVISKSKNMYTVCPDCLKAHILATADESELDERTLKYVGKLFKGKPGHDGYYLDEGKLIKFDLLS